ncbi:MAG: GrpE protein [Actinomycetota bacterium]|jgi:molecular chaperone GrpE
MSDDDTTAEASGAGSPDAVGDLDATVLADGQAVDEAAEAIEHDVEALLKERDEFRDIALRLQADFENFRKRMATQQADEIDRASGKLVEAILPVLDACEAAFSHGVQGVESIWSALIGVLQKQGLEALDLADHPFDPAVAEAVLHEPSDDGGGPVVVEVLRTGYRWKGRVLRPAMVKVRG